jgi:serine/threonine protein kinase
MENFLKSLPDNFELNEFKLERVLGQGGFGITYLALDMNLIQHVAIKEYYPREFANRDSTFSIHAVGSTEDKDTFAWGLKRFLDEARVLAQLSHPSIISVKRFFEAHGTAYLVMEYCDGKPLDEIIRDHGPLNESELNGILFPLLDGLEHVHERAFLHRDIKPANIFIKRNGNPVLLDFGAAKNEMTSHSKSVTSLATAGYAPFEQYSTKGKQGPWSDIYGLAATIYRAISGVKPQDAPDRMLEDTLEPVAELLKGKFNPHLLLAIDRALSIRPGDRPQSIAEFRNLIKSQQVSRIATVRPLPEARTSPIVDPKSAPQTHVDPHFDGGMAFAIGAEDSKSVVSEPVLSNRKYFLILLILVMAAGTGILVLIPNSERKFTSNSESQIVESKDAPGKVTPITVDASQPTADKPVKTPRLVNESIQEKQYVFVPVQTLSFADIDRAIDGGQIAKAQSLLSEVIRNNPDSAGAYFRLGQIFAKEDNYPGAREQLNKAKSIDPSLRFTEPGKYQELYNEILAMEKMSKLPGRN